MYDKELQKKISTTFSIAPSVVESQLGTPSTKVTPSTTPKTAQAPPLPVPPTLAVPDGVKDDVASAVDDDDDFGLSEDEEAAGEDEDYDSNPLYIALSTSETPTLRRAFDAAKLVLLPTRRSVPLDMPRCLPDPHADFEADWESWIASHAFVPVSGAAGDGTEWKAAVASPRREVRLTMQPGSGIVTVRMTFSPSIAPSSHSALPPMSLPSISEPNTPELADMHRSPSTSTNASVPLTQSSCGTSTSRTSSDWSDMPQTPPNSQPLILDLRTPLAQPVFGSLAEAGKAAAAMKAASPPRSIVRVAEARIVSEETLYRRPRKPAAPRPPPPSALRSSTASMGSIASLAGSHNAGKPKKGKEVEKILRFKAIKWLRPGTYKEKERDKRASMASLPRPSDEGEETDRGAPADGPMERVRLISVSAPVLDQWWDLEENELSRGFGFDPLAPVVEEEASSADVTAEILPFPRQGAPTSSPMMSTGGTNRSSLSLARSTKSSLKLYRTSTRGSGDDERRREVRRSRRMTSGSMLRPSFALWRTRTLAG